MLFWFVSNSNQINTMMDTLLNTLDVLESSPDAAWSTAERAVHQRGAISTAFTE